MLHFNVKNLANSNLMQANTESLIRFGSTKTKFQKFLNQSPLHLWLDHTITNHIAQEINNNSIMTFEF